jgi:hypothetical protein
MPTKDQVLELLDQGHSYETAGRALDVPAGQVFMIATGLPADGSDSPSREELRTMTRPIPASPQRLVNPPAFNPTRKPQLMEWVRMRAARDLKQDT